MRAAFVISLVLVSVSAAVATGVGYGLFTLVESRAVDRTMALLVLFSSCVVVFGVVLVPTLIIISRSLQRLRRELNEMAANPASSQVYAGPRWLLPVTNAFCDAVAAFRRRESSLRDELHELGIRHRVVEAERRQIEAVMHALRDGVIVTDAFNEITMVNQTAAEVLGFSREDALRQPIDGVLENGRLIELIQSAREQAMVADRRHVEMDLHVPGAMGRPDELRAFDIVLSCVENHKQEASGVVTILHDITRDRELSRMKSEFVSKASHELRTPLSSIRAYIEMLVDGEAEDEDARREFYGVIQNETDRLSRLIDNMLNISRIEAGIVQIERERVDMKRIIERAIETLEPQAREKSQTLSSKHVEVDLSVEGDSDMLFQVVLNLTSNAIKYTPEGGRITVSADTDNLTQSVLVMVSDTGLGIPPDAQEKLFEKFYRVENYKRVAKGTGLGLNLCKHIVETVHHGQIGVDSKLGMGSKFWFSIPMRYAGAQQAA